MAYRIQFTVTDMELQELKKEAALEGFSSVSALCYSRVFPNSTTNAMFDELKKKVKKIDNDEPFLVRDLFGDRRIPAILGRLFAEAVAEGSIPNVIALGRNNTRGADEYKKIKSEE